MWLATIAAAGVLAVASAGGCTLKATAAAAAAAATATATAGLAIAPAAHSALLTKAAPADVLPIAAATIRLAVPARRCVVVPCTTRSLCEAVSQLLYVRGPLPMQRLGIAGVLAEQPDLENTDAELSHGCTRWTSAENAAAPWSVSWFIARLHSLHSGRAQQLHAAKAGERRRSGPPP